MVQVEPTQEIELQTTENIKGHILTNLLHILNLIAWITAGRRTAYA